MSSELEQARGVLAHKEYGRVDYEKAWHRAISYLLPTWNILAMRWWYDEIIAQRGSEAQP